jgi:F-type H+-transporting ATPase subunit a
MFVQNNERKCLQVEISLTTGYPLGLSTEIMTQWIIMLILAVSGFLLTRNLKTVPNKKQAALEKLYVTVESLVKNTMGESYTNFIPYVGSLIIYLLCLNYTGLIGIKPPTQNLSVTAALGLTTFMTIHYTAIKRNGLLGYAKGYSHPFIVMLPINVMERVMLPVSLALRLFGNMLAATLLVDMVYKALAKIAGIAQIGLPIIVHSYFDVFDGTIQMLVFTMLTMIQIKLVSEE